MTSSFFWASSKALSVSLVSMHLWSCVWYMIACDNISDGGYCTPDTWANTDNLDYGMSLCMLSTFAQLYVLLEYFADIMPECMFY